MAAMIAAKRAFRSQTFSTPTPDSVKSESTRVATSVVARAKARGNGRTLLLHHFMTFRSDSRHFLWWWHGECFARS